MTPIKLIAQLFGLGGMCMLFLLYQQKERKALLKRKLVADILWGIHYILLGAWAGAIPNTTGIFRELIFLRDKKSPIWLFVFISVNWLLAVLTWQSAISLLPMCASTLVTISLWMKKPKMTKILTVPVCTAFIVYDIFVGSYAGIINESVSLLSILISFIRKDKKAN